MQVIHLPEEFRAACNELRKYGKGVGLVPTMGALHVGHASLLSAACAGGNVPCVTIFVNPTQFGPNEDYSKYPRTLESDLELCRAYGTEVVFAPSADAMYFPNDSTRVRVSNLTECLCGKSRPGHFDGVTTIVSKLFALAGPCCAYFGRKDYQQLQVICRMATDLMLPVDVVGCPIVREPDGLALSSRNRYLNADERSRALGLIRGLKSADDAYRKGERDGRTLVQLVELALERCQLRKDYVEIRGANQLESLSTLPQEPGRGVLAVAAFCGATRLIDNVVLGADSLPNVVT
jgi:pantoate--beta-alanine ligase